MVLTNFYYKKSISLKLTYKVLNSNEAFLYRIPTPT